MNKRAAMIGLCVCLSWGAFILPTVAAKHGEEAHSALEAQEACQAPAVSSLGQTRPLLRHPASGSTCRRRDDACTVARNRLIH